MSDEAPWPGSPVPAGSRVAGYRLDEQIGRGGMAVVYRAHDPRLDRQVALKILGPELARDEQFRQRFIRESRAAAAVDHPNIIPVFEAGEADGVLFIAMRYVAGARRRAADRLREGRCAPGPGREHRLPGSVGAGRGARARPGPPGRQTRQHAARPGSGSAPRPRVPVGFRAQQAGRAAGEPDRRPGSSSARWTTSRPSRSRAGRSTAGPTCTRWPARRSRCSPGRRRSAGTSTWPCCGRSCPSRRRG